jgi:undecaprenyl diphosphate synthase
MIPKHIAIIMDGNRRWAKAHGLPPLAGHERVANEILEPLVEHAAKRGVKYITFWAFSTENWRRSGAEVSGILKIFRHVIAKRWQRLHEKGVRVRTIGDLSKFPKDIRDELTDVVEQTKNNKTITAVFALNYGGRDEILRAIRRTRDPEGMTGEAFDALLDTAGIPDPEMIVRTGGEQRLSGFLLWQSEYSEFFFPSWHMPEFTPEKMDELLSEYARRSRRMGK